MLWHEKSWPHIKRVDKNIPVMIPLGSCEQHGRHLPVFTDTLQVSAIAERVDQCLSDSVIITPTLWLGSSHHHKDYPGAISVRPSLYSEIIKDVALSVLHSGFRRLFFLNGHGGNAVPASQALQELVNDNDLASDVYVTLGTWWRLADPSIKGCKLGMASERIFHACEYETSLIMALRPELVDFGQLRQGPQVIDNIWNRSEACLGNRVTVFRRHSQISASGSTGKPSSASKKKGSTILNLVVKETVAFLPDLATWPELPRLGPDDD